MKTPKTIESIGDLSRVRCDETPTGAQWLQFELQINESQVVMLDLDAMLDTWWFAQEMDLISPLPTTWWDDAGEHKARPKLDMSQSNLSDLEELDTFYFEAHADSFRKPVPVFEMTEERTGTPYLLTLFTLLQCVVIAEQMGGIPSLANTWKAKVIPPALRESARVERQGSFH